MFRLLLLASIIPIACAWAARWFFATRVMANGARVCHCDLSRWHIATAKPYTTTKAEAPAREFGSKLYEDAMATWAKTDPKAAAYRENIRRFGMAIPPLAGVVAVLAIIAAKISVLPAVSIFVAAIATAAALHLLTISSELAAITRHAKHLFAEQPFPDPAEQHLVLQCAQAQAWERSTPPILRMF